MTHTDITINSNAHVAAVGADLARHPRYARPGLAARGIAFVASTVLSTVLIGTVAFGMASMADDATAGTQQA
jgi:hypothetical protein